MAERIRSCAMNTFGFFVVNKVDEVVSHSWIQCTDDADAMVIAAPLVTQDRGIEVWDVGRRVLIIMSAERQRHEFRLIA